MRRKPKGYQPVFHRENAKNVVVTMTMHPATARALRRAAKQYSSIGTVTERLVVLFLAADQSTRCKLIYAGRYDPSENHVARQLRRAGSCSPPPRKSVI